MTRLKGESSSGLQLSEPGHDQLAKLTSGASELFDSLGLLGKLMLQLVGVQR